MLRCLAQMLTGVPIDKINAMADPNGGLASKERFFSLSAAREWLDTYTRPSEDGEPVDVSLRKWMNNRHLYRELYGLNAQKAFRAYISDLEKPGGKVLAELRGDDALVRGDDKGKERTYRELPPSAARVRHVLPAPQAMDYAQEDQAETDYQAVPD